MEKTNKKDGLMIRIPTALNKKLTDRVMKIGISKAAFILNLVYEALENKKENDKLKIE